jgi:hypothetical protein
VHTNSCAAALNGAFCLCFGVNEAFCDGGTTRVLVQRVKVCGLLSSWAACLRSWKKRPLLISRKATYSNMKSLIILSAKIVDSCYLATLFKSLEK